MKLQDFIEAQTVASPSVVTSQVEGGRLESSFNNQTFPSESAKVEFWRVRRKLRRHRERLGVMRGLDKFGGASAIFTFTVNDEVWREAPVVCRGCALLAGLPIDNPRSLLARRVNSRLTTMGARLRRLGLDTWVTAKELGKKTGRAHHHRVVDLGAMDSADDLVKYLVLTSPRFRRFRADYVLTSRDRIPIQSGRRSESEILVARWFAAQWGLGYVDCHVVTGGAHACGYVLTYVSKARKQGPGASVRVSYSRAVSRAWGHGAKILVYAHRGECVRYPLYPLGMRLAMAAAVEERYMWRGAHLAIEFGKVARAWQGLKVLSRSEVARRSQVVQWREYERGRYASRTVRQLARDVRVMRERRAYQLAHFVLVE